MSDIALPFFKERLHFNAAFSGNCYHNTILNVLMYYKVEDPVLWLDASIEVELIVAPQENTRPVIKIASNFQNLLPSFSKIIHREFPAGEPYLSIVERNIALLKKGIPVIVGVDVFHLPYQPFYAKNHGYHEVILSGYSEGSGQFTVIDWHSPWFFFGALSDQDFLSARNSENPSDGSVFSGFPISCHFTVIEPPREFPKKNALIFEFISLLSEKYFHSSEKLSEKISGIMATRFLLDEILSAIQNNGAVDYLRTIHPILVKLVHRRNFFSHYLGQICIVLQKNPMAEVFYESAKKNAEQLRILALNVLKMIVRPTPVLIRSFQEIVEAVKISENNLLDSFENFRDFFGRTYES